MNWFETKTSYVKTMENGLQKRLTENYLIDAVSHADAEAKAVEELCPSDGTDFAIESVRRAKIGELFFNEYGGKWYKAKVDFISLDEKTGAEKKTGVKMYAQADDIQSAFQVIEEGMRGTMSDYTISQIAETNLYDVLIYGKSE